MNHQADPFIDAAALQDLDRRMSRRAWNVQRYIKKPGAARAVTIWASCIRNADWRWEEVTVINPRCVSVVLSVDVAHHPICTLVGIVGDWLS